MRPQAGSRTTAGGRWKTPGGTGNARAAPGRGAPGGGRRGPAPPPAGLEPAIEVKDEPIDDVNRHRARSDPPLELRRGPLLFVLGQPLIQELVRIVEVRRDVARAGVDPLEQVTPDHLAHAALGRLEVIQERLVPQLAELLL